MENSLQILLLFLNHEIQFVLNRQNSNLVWKEIWVTDFEGCCIIMTQNHQGAYGLLYEYFSYYEVTVQGVFFWKSENLTPPQIQSNQKTNLRQEKESLFK